MAPEIRPKVMLLHLRSSYEHHVIHRTLDPKASQSRDINKETQELRSQRTYLFCPSPYDRREEGHRKNITQLK